MKNFKIGIIGAGFMAKAIINGLIDSDFVKSGEIIVSAKTNESLEKVAKFGVKTTLDNKYLCDNAEYVIIAVKPQAFFDLATEIKGSKCTKYISIMAGKKIETIKQHIGNVLVARAMPNTPCSIGCGSVGLCVDDFTSEVDKAFIKGIFESFSYVSLCPEKQINAVIGVSGSAPAYFYLFVKSIVNAGIKNGLSYKESLNLATNTMIGGGKLILENTEKSLDELIENVCSKGGTTIQAVEEFNKSGLDSITQKAIEKCIKRAEELENQ